MIPGLFFFVVMAVIFGWFVLQALRSNIVVILIAFVVVCYMIKDNQNFEPVNFYLRQLYSQ
jgi:hypothetical protein